MKVVEGRFAFIKLEPIWRWGKIWGLDLESSFVDSGLDESSTVAKLMCVCVCVCVWEREIKSIDITVHMLDVILKVSYGICGEGGTGPEKIKQNNNKKFVLSIESM